MKRPEIELSECNLCEVCTEACPQAFRLNQAGYIEVIDMEDFPEQEVDEAIKHCPADCIQWIQDNT